MYQSIQELVNPKDHEATFKQAYRHLEDNGRFIVTTHNTNPVDKKNLNAMKFMSEFVNPKTGNKIKFWMSRGFNPKTHIGKVSQIYEEYDKNNRLVSKKMFKNCHYSFGNEEIKALIRKTGFKIKRIYGDYSRSKFTRKSPFRIYELIKQK